MRLFIVLPDWEIGLLAIVPLSHIIPITELMPNAKLDSDNFQLGSNPRPPIQEATRLIS